MVEPNKIVKLYNNKIEIGFWQERHRYSLKEKDGKWSKKFLISVTASTGMVDKSRVLMKWATGLAQEFLSEIVNKEDGNVTLKEVEAACNLYNVKREEAATKGSLTHSYIEQYIKGEKPDLPDDENVASAINAFLDWEKKHKVKWLATEQIVYSKKYGYVGLLDALAVIDRKTVLVDFKTSKGVYNDHLYQVAAYRAAQEEETGKKLSGGAMIVKFDKETAEFEVHECPDHDKDFKAFLGSLALKERDKELKAEWRKNNL